jgi:hypothetical protein
VTLCCQPTYLPLVLCTTWSLPEVHVAIKTAFQLAATTQVREGVGCLGLACPFYVRL